MTVKGGTLLVVGLASAGSLGLGAWFLFEVGRGFRELLKL